MVNLIDADSILYLSLPRKNDLDRSYEASIKRLNTLINDINKSCNTTKYILFITKGKCFRYKNYKYSKGYKHNRKDVSKPPIFYALKEYMIQNYNAYYDTNLEADDLVSYFSTKYTNNIISAIDKDVLYQNIGTHYNYSKNAFITVTYDDVNRFIFTQTLMGDSTDGIEGLEGMGIKTVNKLFENKLATDTYQSICINEYIKKYGIHEGITRFYETFNMIYMLCNDFDMESTIGYLPKEPIINHINNDDNESIDLSKLI